MTQTVSISNFAPTISSEQKRNISELTEWYQEYIDSILEHSGYSFTDYLRDIDLSELGDFWNELDEIGIGFSRSRKTKIIGCRDCTSDELGGRPEYVFLTIEL
jgi:hypothetical protein